MCSRFTNRHQILAIPLKSWDDQEYNPCADGHSRDIYEAEVVPGLRHWACRRCGKPIELGRGH